MLSLSLRVLLFLAHATQNAPAWCDLTTRRPHLANNHHSPEQRLQTHMLICIKFLSHFPQKKSREESSGAGSGIEILTNEPYSDGPGGSGQYTRKIYHVGSHLPGWIKGLLPKSALTVEEEAWNAYPYTKTRYTCPFVEKFSLEIETYYFGDNGNQENVFQLSGQDLRNRVVDLIDVVRDQTYAAEYVREEDPKCFVSEKTGRGPLTDGWLAEHWAAVQGRQQPTEGNRSLMCAYKLCRVEFRYWGMQTKLERFIHDTGERGFQLNVFSLSVLGKKYYNTKLLMISGSSFCYQITIFTSKSRHKIRII